MNLKSIRLYTHEVQGILDGRQSQLRRPVKKDLDHQCWVGNGEGYESASPSWSKEGLENGLLWCGNCGHHAMKPVKCPYGQPRDILWVRETWAKTTNVNSLPDWPGRPHLLLEDGYCIIYKADGEWQWVDDDGFSTEKSYWKPSIHLPKAATRIFLRITDIRVERLQDISEMDAFAEGIDDEGDNYIEAEQARLAGAQVAAGSPAQHSFSCLWERINGAGSWQANPWVWVVKFERIDKPDQIPENSPSLPENSADHHSDL